MVYSKCWVQAYDSSLETRPSELVRVMRTHTNWVLRDLRSARALGSVSNIGFNSDFPDPKLILVVIVFSQHHNP